MRMGISVQSQTNQGKQQKSWKDDGVEVPTRGKIQENAFLLVAPENHEGHFSLAKKGRPQLNGKNRVFNKLGCPKKKKHAPQLRLSLTTDHHRPETGIPS